MKRLLLPLLAALALPTAVNAFWGLSEEEKTICRDRASRERNEFSAKQAYNYCKKNIKSELKEREIDNKKYDRWFKEVGKDLVPECNKKKRRRNYIIDNFLRKNIGITIEMDKEIDDYRICRENIEKSKERYGL